MARITPSSLISLVVLLLIATTSAAIEYKIVNAESGDWMKNFPGMRHTISTSVTVDSGFTSIYERWIIESIDGGFKIKNYGTGYWLTARDGEAVGTPEFDNTASKWIITKSIDNPNTISISVPNQDLVVTPRRRTPDYPITLFLAPDNGSKAQRWSFEHL